MSGVTAGQEWCELAVEFSVMMDCIGHVFTPLVDLCYGQRVKPLALQIAKVGQNVQ
jgi:hypothetical protein